MKLIQQAMEDHYNGLSENEGTHDEDEFQRSLDDGTDLLNDMVSYQTAKRIEVTLANKINRGEDLTDEEIAIAVETIGTLYSNSKIGFSGFGFEKYSDKQLSQKEKSKIAIEAISEENAKKLESFKKDLSKTNADVEDYRSFFSGSCDKLRNHATELLDLVKKTKDSDFGKTTIKDKRVNLALQRGSNNKPFNNYKEVLKALEKNIDSLKIVGTASKYESFGSGKDSKFDLSKLATDMAGRIISKDEDSVTYDLNPSKLVGAVIELTIPNNSDSGYYARTFKSNFVVRANVSSFSIHNTVKDFDVKPLSKAEAIQLLQSVIKHIDEQKDAYEKFYMEAKVKGSDILKNLGKFFTTFIIGSYLSNIYRMRIQDLNTRIHYANNACIRGLILWASESING